MLPLQTVIYNLFVIVVINNLIVNLWNVLKESGLFSSIEGVVQYIFVDYINIVVNVTLFSSIVNVIIVAIMNLIIVSLVGIILVIW